MILIIGAGIAGLTLAQYLKRENIEFVILENKTNDWTGYSLTLMQAEDILRELDLFKNLTDIVTTTKASGYHWNGRQLWSKSTANAKSVVHRGELLRVLREGIDVRSFDYDRYEEMIDHVIVYDKTGGNIICDYLVGCDGLHSRVRKQLIGPDFIEPCLDLMVNSGITEMMCQETRQYLNGESRLFLKPFDAEHVMWQLSYPKRLLNESLLPQEMARTIISGCEFGTDLIDRARDVSQRELLQTQVLDSIQSKRVTVIGDAAHTMSPFKGLGANTAMMDARDYCMLYKLMKPDHLRVFNDMMIKRGNRNQKRSFLATKSAHSFRISGVVN